MLKAMGYCARVTPKGPDGGRDVIASPDALGLESPRIVAEVKHRKGAMAHPRCARSSAGFARAIADSTSPPGASPGKPATRPTAPTYPCACSTSTPLFAIMSRSTTRPTTKPEAFSRSPASDGRRRESTGSRCRSLKPPCPHRTGLPALFKAHATQVFLIPASQKL